MDNDSYYLGIDMAGKDTQDESSISLYCEKCHTLIMTKVVNSGQAYFTEVPRECPECKEKVISASYNPIKE